MVGRLASDRPRRGRVRLGLVALLVALVGACAGPVNEIVEDRFDISEASGTPDVADVTDIGGGDVPLTGVVPMEASDGVAAIGETLWIRGKSFGRQPTVVVGGRPATVLGRSRDGGIFTRVPPLTPSGTQPVVVTNEIGKGERPISVRRYAVTLGPGTGQIGLAEVGPDGPIAAGRSAVPGGGFLALSGDGRAAYVIQAARGLMQVLELPAPGGPKVVYQLELGPAPPIAVETAGHAPVVAVVRADDVELVDTTSPLHPARSTPRTLPGEVRAAHVVAAAISPDGKMLAVATEAGNRVVLLDLVPYRHAGVIGSIDVLPDVRESSLADVAFSPSGDTLWVLSGDTPRNRAVAPQPTELRAIRLGGDPQSLAHLEVTRTVRIDAAADPVRLSAGRAAPLASGATIRLPPERATMFVSAGMRPSAATPAAGAPPPALAAPPASVSGSAAVFRVGAEDTATAAVVVPGRVGLPDLTYDGRWLMVPEALADGSIRILAIAADGRPVTTAVRPVEVIPGGPAELPPAARPVPELYVQP